MPSTRPLRFRTFLAALLAATAAGSGAAAIAAALVAGPEALQPKAATGVDRFLAEHPAHDGRGVVVAIFDTGVDPGASGLQVTPDGRPKVVDIVDGSGSGDVDTSTVVQAGEDGTLHGLSGRQLTVDPDWANPSGDWRIGLKPAAELWPSGLGGRMLAEAAKDRDALGRRILADLRGRHAAAKVAGDEAGEERAEDLERLIEAAEAAHGKGPGQPIHDCVVFHDGTHWRAVVDTDEDGDLRDERPMTNFRVFREWDTFGDADRLNFGVNIYAEGDLLSIVTDCGAHGTHVAGMVAAHFPGEEHLDGIAPGAQIVSVKIGDHRLRSSSTGTGEMRGVVAVLENDVDVVNMSYGGAGGFPNEGLQVDLLSELVNRHGVIFVASAGNDGPALSTVGSPGGTSSAIIGVGAAIDPAMMEQQYSVREPHDELAYTWSSRGPVADGALGVDISAPGGAIAPVPTWMLQRATLMNGTSMSSPSTAGGIALLVSALKAEGRDVDPHAIRRAITHSARVLETTSAFGQGAGMLQVDGAWAWLEAYADAPDAGVRYEVQVDGGRGILLREPHETDGPHVTRVTIDPIFHEDADNERRVQFAMDLQLEASEDWVDVAPSMHLLHGGRSFEVRVDPTDLEPGVHFTTIDAYDAADPDRGPVVRVPVTVIRGESVRRARGGSGDPRLERRLDFEPGDIQRTFLHVPAGATWADLELRRRDGADESRRYWVQSLQLLENRPFTDHHLDVRATIEADDRWSGSFPVVAGGTVEIAVAQFWSSLGESELGMTVTFRGLEPAMQPIVLDGSRQLEPVDVHARFGDHPLSPSGSFTKVRRTLMPMSAEVRAMTPGRDELPDDRLAHELVAVYALDVDAPVRIEAMPAIRFMPGVDEAFFSHIVHVHEAGTGRRIASRSSWSDDPVSLLKGAYEIHYHLVSLDRAGLEAADELPMQVDMHLATPVRLAVHGGPNGPGRSGGGFGTRRLEGGSSMQVHLGLPPLADWPSIARPGDMLVGSMGFGDADGVPGGTGRRPGGWPLMATVPTREKAKKGDAPSKPAARSAAAGADGDADDEADLEAADPADTALAEAIRDATIANLSQREGERLEALAAELMEEFPDHRPLRRALLERRATLAAAADDDEAAAAWDQVAEAADALAAMIDQTALAVATAIPPDADDEDAPDVKALTADLALALHHRAEAMRHRARLAEAAPGSEAAEAVDDAIKELGRWADLDAAAYADLRLAAARQQGRPGEAIELVHAAITRAPRERGHHEDLIELLREQGWDRWADEAERTVTLRFPAAGVVY